MATKWRIKTLNAIVDGELGTLEPSLKARFFRICELLEVDGPDRVGMPHVRHLAGKLWEMRMKGKGGIARAIYFVGSQRRIVVVHVFVKKTQKTPQSAIKVAFARSKELIK